MSHDLALWPPQGNISALIGTSKGVAGVARVETRRDDVFASRASAAANGDKTRGDASDLHSHLLPSVVRQSV